MKTTMVALACAALAGFAAPAAAAEFTPAPNASYAIDLDTEDGNFSEWKLTDLRSLNALRGKVTFLRLGRHDRWLPSTWIALRTGRDFVRFVLATRGGDTLLMRMEKVVEGRSVAEEAFAGEVAVGEPVEVEMDWTDQGRVTLIVRGPGAQPPQTRTMELGVPPEHLVVSGSTGEAMVDPLQLGRKAPG